MSEPVYFKLAADQVGLVDHVKGAPRVVLNLPSRIDLKSEINEEMVIEAMRYTVKNLPFCTIRLHEIEDDVFEQYYYDGEPENLDIVDMSDKTPEDVDAYVLEQASTTFENNCDDSQLYNFKLIRTPGGGHTIYFCGYHLIMDTYGLMYVITYFDKVYSAMKNGTELPAKGMGPEKYIEKSWEYKLGPKNQADIDWWVEQFMEEPHFADMNPGTYPEYVEGKNYGKAQDYSQMMAESIEKKIPADYVAMVNETALAANVSPMIYYALALRTWMAGNSGSDDVTLGTTGARRSTLVYKNCGMTPAHLISWRSIISSDTPFGEAITKLSVTQKDIFRHVSVDLADYAKISFERYGTPADCIYRSCVFTYQPYFDVENIELEFEARHVNVGFTPYPLYLNLMPHDASGELWADYIYGVGYLDPEYLEKYHDFMLDFVKAGIADPTRTIDSLVAEFRK